MPSTSKKKKKDKHTIQLPPAEMDSDESSQTSELSSRLPGIEEHDDADDEKPLREFGPEDDSSRKILEFLRDSQQNMLSRIDHMERELSRRELFKEDNHEGEDRRSKKKDKTPKKREKKFKSKSHQTPSIMESLMKNVQKKSIFERGLLRGNGDSNSKESGDNDRKSRKKDAKKTMNYEDPSDDSSSSDSSSDSSTDTSSEEEGRSKVKRSTIFKSLKESEDNAAKTVVTITRVEKECKVYLKDLKLASLCRAVRDIRKFQDREKTPVNILKIMHESLIQHIELHYGITSTQLQDTGIDVIFEMLISDSIVYNTKEFNSTLKEALGEVNLMSWDKVTPGNHQEYYFQQLRLCEDYMQIFRILLKHNKQWCPDVSTRDQGLLVYFRSLHSREYWDYLGPSIASGKGRHTMQEFINEYKQKALEHFQLSQAMKSIPYASSRQNAMAKSYDDRRENYHSTSRKISSYVNNKYSKREDNFKKDHLNNINVSSSYSSEESDGSRGTWVDSNPRDARDHDKELEDDGHDSLSEVEDSKHSSDKDEDMLTDMLAAFENHKVSTDKKDLPCLRKLMSNKCDAVDCPYGHRRDILLKGAQNMMGKLNTFVVSNGSAQPDAAPPYRIKGRDEPRKL